MSWKNVGFVASAALAWLGCADATGENSNGVLIAGSSAAGVGAGSTSLGAGSGGMTGLAGTTAAGSTSSAGATGSAGTTAAGATANGGSGGAETHRRRALDLGDRAAHDGLED